MEHFTCNSCGKEILESKDDNFLGFDPDCCKHWCGSCFPGILKWIKEKKEKEQQDEIIKELQLKKYKKFLGPYLRFLKKSEKIKNNPKQILLDNYLKGGEN